MGKLFQYLTTIFFTYGCSKILTFQFVSITLIVHLQGVWLQLFIVQPDTGKRTVTSEPFPFKAEQTQFSHPRFSQPMCCCPLLKTFLHWRAQNRTKHSKCDLTSVQREWKNNFLGPNGSTPANTAQYVAGLLYWKPALLAHAQHVVHQHPQVFLCKAAFFLSDTPT